MSQAVSTFAFLFPGNAMVNSLLATTYISIIPNLLLYFVPPNIQKSTLNILVNFAVGSLLGDVFLHLLPHAFQGNHTHSETHSHNEHNNVLIGCGIFAGVFLFYATDKLLRDYLDFSGHDHEHDHSSKKHDDHGVVVDQVAVKENEGLRKRKPDSKKEDMKEEHDHKHQNVRASTYLNLLADFTHNLTDGIAMAASFYASTAVGATTAVAVFFHEIPHEISDYAILVQSGFSKKRAMMAQFTTAVGAYIGTVIGISIEEMARRLDSGSGKHEVNNNHHHPHGLLGTEVTWSDLIIPVTAGGFLYIATVGVVPELLEGKSQNKLQPVKELLAMLVGLLLMAAIAWNESHHH